MIEMTGGVVTQIIGVVMLIIVLYLVWNIAKAVSKGSLVAIMSSIGVAAVVVWVVFLGGLDVLAGLTATEATNISGSTSDLPFNFGQP